jgi:hypothetical protein
MGRSTLTGKRADEAAALFEQGFGCNAIARKMGIDPATVSHWAADVGLKFDRSQTALAVRAHTIDLAETRVDLAKKMAQVASDMLDSLDGEYLVYSFGGKENDYNEHTLDRPPVEVIRNAVTTAGIAFDKATKVVEATPEGLRGAESLIDRLEAGLSKFDDDSDDDDLAV